MKNKIALGTAVLAFSGLSALPAIAQTYIETPDPTLSQLFVTDGGFGGLNTTHSQNTDLAGKNGNYPNSFGLGVGFSGNNFDNLYNNAKTLATAQTIFQPFVYTGNTLGSGSSFEIGLHGFSNSEAANPVETVYASVFSYNASASGAPIGSTVISDIPVSFNPSPGSANDYLYYSATTLLANSLVNGQTYVLGIAGNASASGSSAANFVAIDAANPGKTGVALNSLSSTVFVTDNNSAFSGASGAVSDPSEGPIAFRVYGSTPAAAPEASSFVSLGAFLALLGGLLIKRRLTTTAAG